MLSKITVTALLAGAAIAVPHPSPVAGAASKTSPDAPAGVEFDRRDTGEYVNNNAIANFNADNTRDGIGSGVDSYTMYYGTGDTSDGWPAKSSWVSFENM
jgi:hypothetical protein